MIVTRAGGSSSFSHTDVPLALPCYFVATPLDTPPALLRGMQPLRAAAGGSEGMPMAAPTGQTPSALWDEFPIYPNTAAEYGSSGQCGPITGRRRDEAIGSVDGGYGGDVGPDGGSGVRRSGPVPGGVA